jgi:hypothetical protein
MYFTNDQFAWFLSSESSGLSFAFHEFKNITDSDWTLDISDKCLFSAYLPEMRVTLT